MFTPNTNHSWNEWKISPIFIELSKRWRTYQITISMLFRFVCFFFQINAKIVIKWYIENSVFNIFGFGLEIFSTLK